MILAVDQGRRAGFSGVRGHAPPGKKFKFKSSEMARNASKIVNIGVNF